MFERKIPVYTVCGISAEHCLAFHRRFCKAKNPLWIRFGSRFSQNETQAADVCRFDAGTTSAAAGQRISALLAQGTYDAVWIDWNGDLPVDRLVAMAEQKDFKRLCVLRRILYIGDRQNVLDGMNESAFRALIAQCDLLVVEHGDRRTIREFHHLVAPLQPNLRILSSENAAGVARALEKRDRRRSLQFVLLVAVIAAIFAGLGRLNYAASDTMATFLGTYLQALPFLALGILLSSAIQVFVPADTLQRIFPKKLFTGMLFGVLGGFMLPICDCASIPVFRSLVRKGVPLPAAVTFMIAAPIINPVVMLSTYYAYGGSTSIMLTRMGFGVVCSVMVGLCFAMDKKSIFLSGAVTPVCSCCQGHAHAHAEECAPADAACACGSVPIHTHGKESVWEKLQSLIAHFQTEFFEVVRFLLFGIGVSTVLQLAMGSRLMNMRFSNLAVSMLIMMALAFFLSLCSSSDAVVGKNMGASLPMGAVMSFMVFGPMIDVKNLILMGSSFTKAFMLKLLIVTFTVSFVTVYLVFSLGLGAILI